MARTKNTDIRDRIVALLKREGALSRNKIAEKLGLTAPLPLSAMRTEGLIKSSGATRACVYSAA